MKVSSLVLIILSSLLVWSACSRKTPRAIADPVVTPTPQAEPSDTPVSIMNPGGATAEPSVPADQEEQPTTPTIPPVPEAFVQLSLKKTPCYGKCPVYEFKVYSDGKATYRGKANVERIGYFEAVFSDDKMQQLVQRATALDYFNLSDNYPTSKTKIPDLPNTVSYLKLGKREKQVFNNHDAPVGLLDFEAFIESLSETLEWKAATPKN